MINQVQFPGLGLEFSVNRVAFSVGSIDIYWYGICIALGLALALVYAFVKCRDFGIDDNRFVDVVFLCTIASIVCARLYYVAFAPFSYESLWDVINLRDGGIAIYGAVIGAFVSGYFVCKWRKVPVLPAFDLTAIGFLIGQGVGRWGNFFNQEAFGVNSDGLLRMYSEGTYNYLSVMQGTLTASGVTVDPTAPVHPTFLYESLWCLLGFVLLACYVRHRKFDGEILLIYVMWYGVERAVVEGLRTDALETVMGLRVSQLVAVVSVVVAFVLWLFLRKKYKGKPLIVQYTVVGKSEDGPTVAVVTWPAQQKAPTRQEIEAQAESMFARACTLQRGVWPVGVWHADGVAALQQKKRDNTPKELPHSANGTLPVGVFHTN